MENTMRNDNILKKQEPARGKMKDLDEDSMRSSDAWRNHDSSGSREPQGTRAGDNDGAYTEK